MTWLKQLTPEKISSRLALSGDHITYDVSPGRENESYNQAAVLMPVFLHQQQWHLLYIRRAQHENDPHSDQVAFAGGKQEAYDADLVETALREAEEEIGLMRQHVQVLGTLPAHYSVSRFCIKPVVATVSWPYRLKPDRREVARVFSIPLQWLAEIKHFNIRNHQGQQGNPFPVVLFDEYDGEVLWGATARMTLSLIDRLRD